MLEKVAICPVIKYTRGALTTLIATIIGLAEHHFVSFNGNIWRRKRKTVIEKELERPDEMIESQSIEWAMRFFCMRNGAINLR